MLAENFPLLAPLMPSGTVADQDRCALGCTCVLISARCSFIASVLAAGMMIAAPTSRSGQIAPNM
jgi:hypothetical protein